jgi:hypothetical protein
MKFIPECSSEAFKAILTSNPLMGEPSALYREVFEDIWPQVEVEIFAIDKPFTQLNFPSDGGVTGYFSRNCTEKDLEVAKSICDSE